MERNKRTVKSFITYLIEHKLGEGYDISLFNLMIGKLTTALEKERRRTGSIKSEIQLDVVGMKGKRYKYRTTIILEDV